MGNGVTETRTYSTDNLLTGISYGGTGTSIGNLSYTWDANKNKTSEGFGGTMSGYGFTSAGTNYDDEDRLTGFARTNGTFHQSWNLTKVGDWTNVITNGTAQNRTHGPTHELLTAGGQSLETDPKGNITLLPLNLTPQSSPLALQWDFDNKLRSADLGNNNSVDVNFQYDALGRRVARTGTGGSVVYVQHDQQTIADYPVGGVATTPTNRYVYASYIDEPVVRKAAGTSGTIHYYHRNQQYSITAMTTLSGAVAERYAYTAYGQPTILNASGTVLTSSAVGNRYTYTGREWDETLGLHHFRARWMSPLAGRFLGRDPIGYSGGILLYGGFSFLNVVDPTGHRVECPSDISSCGNKWVEVTRPDEPQDFFGTWSMPPSNLPPAPALRKMRGAIDYEWIAADAGQQTSNCGVAANFTIGFQTSHSYTYGVGVGGIINLPVGGGEVIETTVTGDYSYSWSTSTSSGVEEVYQEDCHEFRSVPMVLTAHMWDEIEYRGRVYRFNPHWPRDNMLYVSGGLLICKRKCCKCCAEVGEDFDFDY
jgi:RHS repeat-associated protein